MGGLFITFEGLDGSGKTSHLQRIAAQLRSAGMDPLETKEPGGTPLADAIRSVFLDPEWTEMDGRVELMLVFASRRQHLVEQVEPALEGGRVVLCDRFTDSTYAYQGHGRNVDLATIKAVDEIATGRRRPDRTVLFDLPPEVAHARGQSSSRRALAFADGGVDRIDGEDLAFYERVRKGFLAQADGDPERFRVVDSAGALEDTARQVRAALVDVLPSLADSPPGNGAAKLGEVGS